MESNNFWQFNLGTAVLGLALCLVAFFMPKEINAAGLGVLLIGYFIGQIKLN